MSAYFSLFCLKTPDNWHVVEINEPEQEIVDWLIDFEPDYWVTALGHYNKALLIGIKDPSRFLMFKLRWWGESHCADIIKTHPSEFRKSPFEHYENFLNPEPKVMEQM